MNHILGKTQQRDLRGSIKLLNGAQFKSHRLFISGIFHVTFQIVGTETTESETADKGETTVHVVPILLGETLRAEGN